MGKLVDRIISIVSNCQKNFNGLSCGVLPCFFCAFSLTRSSSSELKSDPDSDDESDDDESALDF